MNSTKKLLESEEVREFFVCGPGCHQLALVAYKWHEELDPDIFLSIYSFGQKQYEGNKKVKNLDEITSKLQELIQVISSSNKKSYKLKDIENINNLDEDKIRYIWFSILDILKYGVPYGDEVILSPDDAKRLSKSLNRLGKMKPIEEQS